jgi:hypothetical protein
VIAGGNHLATQVKDNQPKLRRRLELGSQWRRPIELAENRTVGRNRWEMRELKVFPAKAWFRGTPWDSLLNTVLRLDRTVWTRSPATGLLKRTAETVFWVSSAAGRTAAQWLAAIRGHWRIENASHYVRDTTFAEDASRIRIKSGHRRAPALLRLQSTQSLRMRKRPKRPLARRAGRQPHPQNARNSAELNSPDSRPHVPAALHIERAFGSCARLQHRCSK